MIKLAQEAETWKVRLYQHAQATRYPTDTQLLTTDEFGKNLNSHGSVYPYAQDILATLMERE